MRTRLVVAGVILAFAAAGAAEEAVRIDPLVLSGEQAPGLPAGVVFQEFPSTQFPSGVASNESGESAFVASLSGPGVTSANDFALFGPDGAGGFALVAREGDPSPVAGLLFGQPALPRIDAAGGVGFVTVAAAQVIWGPDGAGGSVLVVRPGDPAPGLPGLTITATASHVVFNAAGHVLFLAFLAGPGVTLENNSALYLWDGVGMTRVMREGDPAPGTTQVFHSVGTRGYSLGDNGHVVFRAFYTGSDEGIWLWDPAAGLSAVALAGDPAPGTGFAGSFQSFWTPVVNAAGDVLFWADAFGSTFGGRGIWRSVQGVIAPLALDPPGLPGWSFDTLNLAHPRLNAAGDASFGADVVDPGGDFRFGVWGPDASGGVRLLGADGLVVPGVPDVGVGWGSPFLNERGDFAYVGTGLAFGTRDGVFATLTRIGDAIEVAPGDVRTVSGLSLVDYLLNDVDSFDQARRVGFRAAFTDGTSGLFRAHAARCSDAIDNDGDGLVDWPADPGCADPLDVTERGATYACDNGVDDDGDGYVDFTVDLADGGDPACPNAFGSSETSQCQDGIDNDGDGLIDFDGGASLNGGVPLTSPDPQCVGRPWRNLERKSGACGLGFETALLLAPLLVARRRSRQPKTG